MENKGFTLIELLASVAILGILIALAIPAVTSQIVKSRTNSFVENANRVVTTTKDAVLSGKYEEMIGKGVTENNGVISFNSEAIKELLEKGYDSSPFGGTYVAMKVEFVMNPDGIGTVYVCMIDSGHNGFEHANGMTIKRSDVQIGTVSNLECGTLVPDVAV